MKLLYLMTAPLALGLTIGSAQAAYFWSGYTKPTTTTTTTKPTTTTTTTTTTTVSAYTSGAATLNHAGRLLASNCFQCHGTNGHGMESLAGESAREISSELFEMKQKPAGAEMMNVHAQGYTTDQINKIADYFSKQQP